MCISVEKSGFLFNNMEVGTLHSIYHSLPYKMEHISKVFKYLGYFIKPLRYEVKDWFLMVQNFERRIKHWAHKLLSLGGRLVMIRVVMSSMHVYWMALAPIPISIMVRLMKLIFDFLWGSSEDKNKYHLVDWKLLSKPKDLGG